MVIVLNYSREKRFCPRFVPRITPPFVSRLFLPEYWVWYLHAGLEVMRLYGNGTETWLEPVPLGLLGLGVWFTQN